MLSLGTNKLLLLLAITVTVNLPVKSMADAAEKNSASELSYGTSLFNFFQDKYFSAITDLTVAKHYKKLDTDDKNAELLLGGMYLSYGLPDKASEVFTELLEQDRDSTSQSVRDKALYHAGKYYYDVSRLDDARNHLIKIGNTLDDAFNAEKLYMLVNIYLRTGEYKEAIPLLDAFPGKSIWRDYAQFNIGTSLIRSQQYEEGIDILEAIASAENPGYEKQILKDKANIAIAYTYMQQNNPVQANSYFERVRLHGSQTSDALLGLGWSWYQQNIYDKALLSWLELSNQPFSSYAKQEALITIPYVFEKSDKVPDALHHYNIAIDNYANEITEINQVIKNIRNGNFIHTVKALSADFESSNPNVILKNIEPAMHKYLATLFISRDFHEALKNLQELRYLAYMLDKWETNLPALALILEEKRLTYNRKIKDKDHQPLLDRTKQLVAKRNALAEKIRLFETDDTTLSMVTEAEQEQLGQLNQINQRISQIKNTSDIAEQQNKYRLIQGLLSWQITTDYAARLWETRKTLHVLDAAINQMNKSITSLSNTWKQAPARHRYFIDAIREKEARLIQLHNNIQQSIIRQENIITSMALEAASQYANRIKMLHDRALFAKARIHDAVSSPGKEAAQ